MQKTKINFPNPNNIKDIITFDRESEFFKADPELFLKHHKALCLALIQSNETQNIAIITNLDGDLIEIFKDENKYILKRYIENNEEFHTNKIIDINKFINIFKFNQKLKLNLPYCFEENYQLL